MNTKGRLFCRAMGIGLTFLILVVLLVPGCAQSVQQVSKTGNSEATVAVEWMKALCDGVRSEGLSPPVASRIYAYAGVTLYESVVGGMSGYRSLSGQLNAMPPMPQPQSGQTYDWPSSATLALATVSQGIFASASPATLAGFQQLCESQLAARESAGVQKEVIDSSAAYGESVGKAILDWANSDGYQATRGLSYTPPTGPGLWVPTPPGYAAALEPYWGDIRPFVMQTADACLPPPPITYSEQAGSAFYQQAWYVYNAVNTLDEERMAIAEFWADNAKQTSTPPGHWLIIENQMVEQLGVQLDKAAEMYALVGVAMGDAFISCWSCKYEVSLLRPITYIQQLIDANWNSAIVTPPFPEYTSGHSVVSGAADAVLTSLLGTVAFTDKTHEDTGMAARSFASFDAAAQEAAVSRLYAGIHYPMAIINGLAEGKCVGQWVLDHVHTRS